MIGLIDYKNYLINKYSYEIDNNDIKRNNRKQHLIKYYSDEYLEKIINDTYSVIREIFDRENQEYFNIKLYDYNNVAYVSLNLHGGWFSDRLYIDSNNRIISEYILKHIFGNKICIFVNEEEYRFDSCDPDIVSFNYENFLILQNFPDNMSEIKKNLFDDPKVKQKIK